MYWPYKNIEYSDFEKAVLKAEQIIQRLGAVCVNNHLENKTRFLNDSNYDTQLRRKEIFKFRDEYVQVDNVYFSDAPCIVLGFGNTIEGPYEDADPFLYDLPSDEFEKEIKYSMSVDPCPEWKERAIKEKKISDYAHLLAKSENYIVYNELEDVFLLDTANEVKYNLEECYGDSKIALIDKRERFAVVVGSGHMGTFDMVNKILIRCRIDIPERIYSIDQEDRIIHVICECGKTYTYDV